MPDQIIRILQVYCTHCHLATPKKNAHCIHCGKAHLSAVVAKNCTARTRACRVETLLDARL